MKKSAYISLFAGFLIYGCLVLVLILTFTQRMTAKNARDQEASRLYREASLIASDYATDYYKSSISLNEFQEEMEMVSGYLDAEIWILDDQGNMLFDSSDATVAVQASAEDPVCRTIEGFQISDFGSSYYMIGNFYDNFYNNVLSTFATISINYKVRGYVLIHKALSSITGNADGFLNISFYTAAIVFAGALILMLWFTARIFRPLSRITKGAQQYAKGNFSQKIDVKGTNELSYLAGTLNYMADELDKMEEDQKKFISNVSHDFRSPLTSIKGYVEAMIDGTIPVEFQEKYLNIILFETERLTKLTQGLLELNQFGSHGIHLNIVDFDINQMIRNTAATFEGTCSSKNLKIGLVLTGKELYVRGDTAKIQQVLYNLIDNATKFSRPDTEITVETHVKNEKLLVSVKDRGIGIAPESISKIWDRFYKADQSRGRDKKGTGLGLAIVKEIINAHKENINVISTQGVGTEFIFTLTLAARETN